MTYLEELSALVASQGGPVKASTIADVMRQGGLPSLRIEVCHLSKVPNDRTPTTQEVGNALARLSGVTSKRDRTKTARWYPASAAEVPIPSVLPAAHDVGHAGRHGVAGEGIRVNQRGECLEDMRRSDGDAARLEALLKATRRSVQFARLCDVLDLSPAKVRKLVTEAQTLGYTINVAGNDIGWQEPEPANDPLDVVAQADGDWTRVAIASDWHAGSKYCLRHYIDDFLKLARDWCGERTIILSAGDQVDGAYDHGKWELTHHGLEEQIDDFLDIYKPRPGQDLFYIDGNHDQTFWNATGYPTGKALEEAARARGRTDLHYLGARGATITIGGVKIALWHPKPKKSYALSYPLQNYIRDIPLGRKPDILLAGHWHARQYFEQRGVHAFGCPCFQGGGSAFGKSLGGAPSIGGWLLAWRKTEHGTLRDIEMKPISYYEVEQVREVS